MPTCRRGNSLAGGIPFFDDLKFTFGCPAPPPDVACHQFSVSILKHMLEDRLMSKDAYAECPVESGGSSAPSLRPDQMPTDLPPCSTKTISMQLGWIVVSVRNGQAEFTLDCHAGQSTKVSFTALKENHDRKGHTFSQWMQKRIAAEEFTSPAVRPFQDAQLRLGVIVVNRGKWHEVLHLLAGAHLISQSPMGL